MTPDYHRTPPGNRKEDRAFTARMEGLGALWSDFALRNREAPVPDSVLAAVSNAFQGGPIMEHTEHRRAVTDAIRTKESLRQSPDLRSDKLAEGDTEIERLSKPVRWLLAVVGVGMLVFLGYLVATGGL